MATTQYYNLLIIEGSSLIGALANDNPQKIDTALHDHDVSISALNARVPAPSSVANKFLRDDGTWQAITMPGQATSSTLGTLKIGYTQSGKNYPLVLDSNGKGYVNVPWTDTNTTYSQATSSTLGLVKIGYTTSGKNYAVQLNSSGQMYVNVPWTDTNTTYSEATSSAYGLIKIGYTASGKNYPVQLSGGKAYVYVPWTDTNTTYSVATSSANGLMSASDKGKLDGIAAGAQKNPGNFGGATSSKAGSAGLVPAPTAGGQYKVLYGEGGWANIQDIINVASAKAYSGIQNTAQKIEFRLGNQDNVAAINNEVSVNFSPAFSNGCHVVIPILRSNLNGVYNRFTCYDWSKTGFKYKAQNGSSANISFTWFAIGY